MRKIRFRIEIRKLADGRFGVYDCGKLVEAFDNSAEAHELAMHLKLFHR